MHTSSWKRHRQRNTSIAAALGVLIQACAAMQIVLRGTSSYNDGYLHQLEAIRDVLAARDHQVALLPQLRGDSQTAPDNTPSDLRIAVSSHDDSEEESEALNAWMEACFPREDEKEACTSSTSMIVLRTSTRRVRQSNVLDADHDEQTNLVMGSMTASLVDGLAKGWTSSPTGTPLLPPGIGLFLDMPAVNARCTQPIFAQAPPDQDFVIDAEGIPTYPAGLSLESAEAGQTDDCVASISVFTFRIDRPNTYAKSAQDHVERNIVYKANEALSKTRAEKRNMSK